jgi:hypothetical protein
VSSNCKICVTWKVTFNRVWTWSTFILSNYFKPYTQLDWGPFSTI